jgi:hypothetical protein
MLRVIPTALTFAAFLAVIHAIWAFMVYMLWAQPFLDFIFDLHFITPPYRVEAFEAGRAVMLLVVTAGIGLLGGGVFALAWNLARTRSGQS